MDHIKDLLAEVNDFYMVLGEHADTEEQIMRELMQPENPRLRTGSAIPRCSP